MKLEIPARPFKAYLFDLDGTIADSMPLHFRAWNETLRPFGVAMDEKLFLSLAGVPGPETVESLNQRFGVSMPPQVVAQAREEAYIQAMDQVRPVPEVVEQIRTHRGRLPLAVVSGSPRDSIHRTLGFLGLLDCFDTIVGAEDYSRGKPSPDPYLEASRRLAVAPVDCLVFEDAELGIESARRAGMAWVRVLPDSVAGWIG